MISFPDRANPVKMDTRLSVSQTQHYQADTSVQQTSELRTRRSAVRICPGAPLKPISSYLFSPYPVVCPPAPEPWRRCTKPQPDTIPNIAAGDPLNVSRSFVNCQPAALNRSCTYRQCCAKPRRVADGKPRYSGPSELQRDRR